MEVNKNEMRDLSESLDLMALKLEDTSVTKLIEEVEGDEEDLLGDEQAIGGDLEDDGTCEPSEHVDIVDEAIDKLACKLSEAGYTDDASEDAVFDAMADLMDENIITDTPEMNAPDGEKAAWVFNSIPKITLRLKEMGLEFQ